jgi:hypothetical protein
LNLSRLRLIRENRPLLFWRDVYQQGALMGGAIMISVVVAAGRSTRSSSDLPTAVNSSEVEAFRRSLLRLRGEQRELVLMVFEHHIKARLFKNSNALSRAWDAMLVVLRSWDKGWTMEDHAAMEVIFDLIHMAQPRRQEGAYRRQVAKRNQELGDRKSKISRSQFLDAVRRHQHRLSSDSEIAIAIALEFQYADPQTSGRETVARRIRRYRAQGDLPKRRGRGRSVKKAR